MRCASCQHENPPEARFCGGCGEPLATTRACPSCETPNPPGHRFCHACGTALTEGAAQAPPPGPKPPSESDPRAYTPRHLAERILTSKSTLEGERRRVTVVFMDVAGFTTLSENADPEQMHAVMDRCFRILAEQVHAFEGTINQFTGDGIMALFGAPVAIEDAPRRAVAAALRCQDALEPVRREVRERLGAEFRIRVGINTGLVVVGRIGDDLRMDYTAVGDTTNLAARLEQMAEPGTVLLSETTAALVEPYFELREVGEATVKGRRESVRAFLAISERQVGDRVDAAARRETGSGLTPLAGRQREIDALLSAFASAQEGHGQVVFLAGEAGIGKSRLLHEFRQAIQPQPHSWFEGRCASYGRNTAFGPIADGLRRRFGIDDRDDDATALAKLERAEAEWGGELDWTLPYLRALLSLPVGDAETEQRMRETDPGTRRSETLRSLQARFVRTAAKTPLVLVIEDLHWIDAASEEVLAYLCDSVPASRVLLVLTHRPGYQHPFGDRSFHTRIGLQALSPDEMAQVASSVLSARELPEELKQLIAAKAEGNPLFIEEMTQSLLEEGALRIEEDRVLLSHEISQITIPDRIQDVLMARLDRLPEGPRRAIQVASVIGREFAMRLLERIHEADAALQPIVEELRSLELIYEKASHPELAYMFKHALTHDVAYESVLRERRRALHRIVGTAIEELYRDRLAEHYEALAHHFSEAEDWPRAFQYHEQAAAKAADAFANHAAANHCRQALAIAERLEAGPAESRVEIGRKRSLAIRLARATMAVSEFLHSGDAHLQAAELSESPGGRAGSLCAAAYALHWAHDYERSTASTQEALGLARAHDARDAETFGMLVDAFRVLTQEGMKAFTDEDADELLRRASGEDELASLVLHHIGEAAEWAGDYERAIGLQRRALEIATRLKLPDLMVQTRWFIAKASCCLGRYGQALSLMHEAADVSNRVGDRAWQTRLMNTLGWCLAEIGADDRASDYNRLSTELAEQMVKLELVAGAPELYGNAAVNLACNEIALGQIESARDRLAIVREDVEGSDDAWMRWRYSMHFWDVMARAELAGGEPEAALAWTQREIDAAREQSSRKLLARGLEMRGRALVTIDDRDQARATLDEAIAEAAAIGYPPVRWRAFSLLAELARRDEDGAAAARHTLAARELVEHHALQLDDLALRGRLQTLGRGLIEDPLGAWR